MFDLRAITIISGGQTGADRAALDFAIEHEIPHGGWCPRGRRAEDGPIADRYLLLETRSRKYRERTERNVQDSDATVVFSLERELRGGTALTLALAQRLGKPWLRLDRETNPPLASAEKLAKFLRGNRIERLNIAGPRESQAPEIAGFVRNVLRKTLKISLL